MAINPLSVATDGFQPTPLNPLSMAANGVGSFSSSSSAHEASEPVLLPNEISLAKTIEILSTSSALGIHQSDIIIRTAIVIALADLRKNPNLLDYVFASLPRDELTYKQYGRLSSQKAKEWFLKTDIPVSMVPRMDEGKLPRITISLDGSTEFENTLGDVHYDPVEFFLDDDWPDLTELFAPISFNYQTGRVLLPTVITNNLLIVPGMYIVDAVGRAHKINGIDDNGGVFVSAGLGTDFSQSVIRGFMPIRAEHLESATFKETYHIGVHVGSEPVYLTWLHSIVKFALLRYRRALMESRGFERSFVTSSQLTKNDTFDSELVFSRYITINGVVRHYWPKDIVPTVNSVVTTVTVEDIDWDSDGIG